jgi:hypothetical protein
MGNIFSSNKYLGSYAHYPCITACRSSCKVVIKIVLTKLKWIRLNNFLRSSQMSNFMKIHPAVLELFHAYRHEVTEHNSCSKGLKMHLKKEGTSISHKLDNPQMDNWEYTTLYIYYLFDQMIYN